MTGLLRDSRVHHAIVRDVEYSLYSLNKTLAAHREAWRYVSVASDAEQRDIEEMTSPSLDVKYERKRWRDDMRERSQIWRERARPGLYGALFGREEMEPLVAACGKWTNRLKQTLELILLTLGPPTPDFWRSEEASVLAIVGILERQRRARTKPLGTYNTLPGKLRETLVSPVPPTGLVKTVYKDDADESDVMVEARSEGETPTDLLCHLTWLLQAPFLTEALEQGTDYKLHTLSCMGFIDDPINNRGLILYRSPQSHPWASNPLSLHTLIDRSPGVKRLSLSNRYRIAKALAATVLETHASGWFHRNLCSRSVLMLPQSLNNPEPSPHLVGWGVPQRPEMVVFDLEPNIYQHKDRFGKPSNEYTNDHDIYSLGVVLLELGLWKTISTIFARRLGKSPQFNQAQQQAIFPRINNALIEFASSSELKREMGDRYAEIVLSCLTWHSRDFIEGTIEFRKQIVDSLVARCMI